MRKIEIADITLRNCENYLPGFKEKVETARLLDKLNADVIETPPLTNSKADVIFLHTIAGIVKNSVISVPVNPDEDTVKRASEALGDFPGKAVNILIPASTVQMEYLSHKKPSAMLEALKASITEAVHYFTNIEVSLLDATRAEREFLIKLIDSAIDSGASCVTLCDDTGEMLPSEFTAFIRDIKDNSALKSKGKLGISCVNRLHMAAACVISSAADGADRIKTSILGSDAASLKTVAGLLRAKGDALGISTSLNMTVLENCVKQTLLMANGKGSSVSSTPPADMFNGDEDIKTISDEIAKLGYDLSEEDVANVYSAFIKTAAKKKISVTDLDAIIASEALQVPPTYKIGSYVINIGNVITPMAHIKLLKNGEELSGFNVGDGPIDAAFKAIEQIAGSHNELDDFQIQAVTRGREALGCAIVKLRSNGKLYSGKGISTDIVGASINAYINALNKICFEEEI